MDLINGLNRKYIEGSDVEYIYYSKHMLKDNLIIVANTFPYEDCSEELGWNVATSVEVKYYNDVDAVSFTVYQGDYLHDIQVYRIVNDIYDLYLDNVLSDFLKIIYELSVGSQSQSMQSKKEYAINVRNRILTEFGKINW
ncbi:hypothetical protein [Virgibacillus sp. SK37]|uniref:hypothetical protein n=1 Tax=Virgibacillus sp. SK37 TaxID=403957 RepID=UPI0004D0CDF9|nr:hypothetical protein [Virgibacillus sp. SK37]AIF45081.1 hypothetical protein X953_01335 [Virgibacillus sp. SK37]